MHRTWIHRMRRIRRIRERPWDRGVRPIILPPRHRTSCRLSSGTSPPRWEQRTDLLEGMHRQEMTSCGHSGERRTQWSGHMNRPIWGMECGQSEEKLPISSSCRTQKEALRRRALIMPAITYRKNHIRERLPEKNHFAEAN